MWILLSLLCKLSVLLFASYLSLAHIWDSYVDDYYVSERLDAAERFDFIVVGAGSAGATLAARLSKNGWRTLLLEAGLKAPYFADVPVFAPMLQNSPYDWQYSTEPQEHACKGLKNHVSKWPMGKVLGGSSRLNYMAYVVGHPLDYHQWFPDYSEPLKENGGFVEVSAENWSSKFADILLNATKEISKDRNFLKDFGKPKFTSIRGKRWSSDRILEPNANLKILPNSFARKILLESKKAVGVELVRGSKTFSVFGSKGIVISAGAIGSPKLLMLSGIGPRGHLEDMEIEPLVDLPVGENLMDHILTGLDLVTVESPGVTLTPGQILDPMSALEYFLHGSGPWTSAGIEVSGTLRKIPQVDANGTDVEVAPHLQIMMMPTGMAQDYGSVLRSAMGITDKIHSNYFAPLMGRNTVTIAPVLLHPRSRGWVRLRSKEPSDPPLIDPRYLSHRDDIETLMEGIDFIKDLLETESMRAIGASLYNTSLPGCEDLVFDSRDYWHCYIRHLTLTTYHPAGTCGIGRVVDSEFRVYGMENLYVVDASVLPRLPSGNINAAVTMIAEKAAKLFGSKVSKDSQSHGKVFFRENVCSKVSVFLSESSTF